MSNEPVCLSVPMSLYGKDPELNTMDMLRFVMEHQSDVLLDDEVKRIATWFAAKFGK